jgi:hypothetical protein
VSFLSEPLVELMDGKRKERKATTARKTKKLGRVAQASIAHNEDLVEKFIDAVQEGKATPYQLAVAEGNPEDPKHPGKVAFGGGVFSVRVLETGTYERAALRGLMHGRGGFFHNPEVSTAVRPGSYVLVEDLGLGRMAGGTSHQIMGVLSSGQASRARSALGIRGASSENSLFRRSSEERRNVGIRAARMAELNRGYRRATQKKAKSSSNTGAAAAKKSSNSYRGEGW